MNEFINKFSNDFKLLFDTNWADTSLDTWFPPVTSSAGSPLETVRQPQRQGHVGRVLVVGDVVDVMQVEDRALRKLPEDARIVLEAPAVQLLLGLGMQVARASVEDVLPHGAASARSGSRTGPSRSGRRRRPW